MPNGPIAVTEMSVVPFAAAQWCAFAAIEPFSPTAIGFAFAASKVSPIPTSSVPFLTSTVSSVGWKCGRILYPFGKASSTVNGPALPGSPLTTAILAPGGKTAGARPQCRALGVAWECSGAAMSTRHAGTVRMRIGPPRDPEWCPKIGRRTEERKRAMPPYRSTPTDILMSRRHHEQFVAITSACTITAHPFTHERVTAHAASGCHVIRFPRPELEGRQLQMDRHTVKVWDERTLSLVRQAGPCARRDSRS